MVRQIEPLEQFGSPRHRLGIEELRGAGDRHFRTRNAGEPVVEQIRNTEQARRHAQRGRPREAHGIQLIQRVDLHELNAGVAEDLVARHGFEELLHHPVVARVAVVAGIIEQQPVTAEQCAIDAPGIDADAVEREFALAGGDGDAVLNLVPQAQDVPVECALHADRRIGKPVEFLHGKPAAGKAAQQRAPTLGAEIDG